MKEGCATLAIWAPEDLNHFWFNPKWMNFFGKKVTYILWSQVRLVCSQSFDMELQFHYLTEIKSATLISVRELTLNFCWHTSNFTMSSKLFWKLNISLINLFIIIISVMHKTIKSLSHYYYRCHHHYCIIIINSFLSC